MKLYVSGPMSGHPAFNIPAFDDEAESLRLAGHDVVSPAELDDPAFRDLCMDSNTGDIDELHHQAEARHLVPETWGSLLARDIKLLADDGIEGIVVMPGWINSRGARLETFAGRVLGLPILENCGPGIGLELVSDLDLERAHGMTTLGLGRPLRECGIGPSSPSLIAREEENTLDPAEQGRKLSAVLNKSEEGLPKETGERPNTYQSQKRFNDKTATRINGGYSAIMVNEVPVSIPYAPGGYRATDTTEIRVVNSKTGGEKGEKPEAYDLLPWPALDEVARLYHFGATKYAPNNWRKGFRWGLCFASMLRHARAFWNGQSIDAETGCHHLASVAFHALTLMEFDAEKLGEDDRAIH